MVYDIYANASLNPGDHPKPFSHSSTSSYFMKIGKGETQLIDVQRASTVSFQIDGTPADLLIDISNQDYRVPDYPTYPVVYNTNPTAAGAIPDSEFDTPNTPTVWTPIAPPTSTFMKLDVTAVSQLRLQPASGMVIHLEMDEEVSTYANWVTDTAGAITGGNTLADILTELQSQNDFEPQLVQQNGTDDYYYSVWQWSEDGATQSLVYYDMSGAPVPAPSDPIPVQQKDYEVIETCYETTAAGTGYAVGDQLKRLTFFDVLTQSVISEVWFNISSATALTAAPPAGDIAPCAPDFIDIEQEKLYDYLPTGERVDFLRTYVKDASGATKNTVDTTVDGVTAYATAGTVEHTPQRRTMGYERIKFSDGGVNNFSAFPPGTEYAEYHVWGGDCVITTSGFPPADAIGEGIRLCDGASPELESYDEINGFQVIGQSGQSGIIYVEYFSHR